MNRGVYTSEGEDKDFRLGDYVGIGEEDTIEYRDHDSVKWVTPDVAEVKWELVLATHELMALKQAVRKACAWDELHDHPIPMSLRVIRMELESANA